MNAKEKTAINMLNRGMSVSEVAKKTGLSKTWLELQQERMV
jgi:transposase